jgi:hypothetical protein
MLESERSSVVEMAQKIKVQVTAGESLRFPQICVNCSRPATTEMALRKRRGRVTREIAVPLCSDCKQELERLSFEEERWYRFGWLFGGLTLIVVWIVLLLLLPAWLGFGLRLLLGLLLAMGAAAAVFLYCRKVSVQHARPEKKAILEAARLCDFSWRFTTFEFNDDSFAERFKALNETKLTEVTA